MVSAPQVTAPCWPKGRPGAMYLAISQLQDGLPNHPGWMKLGPGKAGAATGRQWDLRKMQNPPSFYSRMLMGACLAALAGLSSARAEMLQFATPEGTKSWPKLETITDWHQDQEASMKLAANVIIPDGVETATAEMKIEARGVPRNTSSLSQLIDADRAANSGGADQKQADLFDKDGTPFTIYSFAPATGSGNWKTVGYSEEGDTLLAFTLTARSKAAHDKGLTVFADVIHKYAREIPW